VIIPAADVTALRAVSDIDTALAPFTAKVVSMLAPCNRYTVADVDADFANLQRLDAASLMTTAASAPMKIGGLPPSPIGSMPRPSAGLIAADAWQARERWRARYTYDPSPLLRWHDPWYITMQLRHLVKTKDEIAVEDVRHIVLRMGYTPCQFPPAVAKAVIDWCQAKTVVDPCAGWGDRLVGALASAATSYVGIDTNRGVHWGYERAAEHFRGRGGCVPSFRCADATKAETWVGLNGVDLVLTSPPHANFELYDDAYNGKETAEEWGRRFAQPLAVNACASLRSGGILALHLSNVRIRQTEILLVPALQQAVATTPLVFIGSLGLLTHARSVTEGRRSSAVEPILLWRKP
jgi:hypothetical protein